MARLYVPKWSFMHGSTELLDWVIRFFYEYGRQIIESRKNSALLGGNGEMIFRNFDGYWTEDKLDLIDDIDVFIDGHLVLKITVESYERNVRQHNVRLGLQSRKARDYGKVIDLDATAQWNESELLSQLGITLDNQTAWDGWRVDRGSRDCGDLFDFIQNFGIFAGALVYEDYDGAFGAILPITDKRSPAGTIAAKNHVIDKDYVAKYIRRGWRRNGQRANTSDPVYHIARAVYPNDDDITDSNVRLVSDTGGVKTLRVDLRPLGEIGTSFRDFDGFSHFTWKPNDTYVVDRKTGNNIRVSREQRIFEGTRHGGEPTVYVDVDIRSEDSASQLIADLEIENDFWIDAHWFTADDNGTRRYRTQLRTYLLVTPDKQNSYLQFVPFSIAEGQEALFGTRLAWWKDVRPIVTLLNFPLAQKSRARWEEIRDINLGDIYALNANEPAWGVSNESWAMYKRWEYRPRELSHVRVGFLSTRESVTPPTPTTGGAETWREQIQIWRGDTEVWRPTGAPPPPPVIAAPTAGFTVAKSGRRVTVANTATGVGPLTYSYNMGDGNVIASENPVYTYTDNGTYTITQTVTNAGGSDMHAETVIVSGDPPATVGAPTAGFIWVGDPGEGNERLIIVQGEDIASGGNLTYRYDMGDGSVYTTENVRHTYARDGDYMITQTVTNTGGSDTHTEFITIPVPFVLGIDIIKLGGRTVHVFERVAPHFSGGISTLFDWGDGAFTGRGETIHTYARDGTYNIRVTSTRGDETLTFTGRVTVP